MTGRWKLLVYVYSADSINEFDRPVESEPPLSYLSVSDEIETWPGELDFQLPPKLSKSDADETAQLVLVLVLDLDGDKRLGLGDYMSRPVPFAEDGDFEFEIGTSMQAEPTNSSSFSGREETTQAPFPSTAPEAEPKGSGCGS